MKVLLLGFDPFGGEAINPAWEVVQRVGEDLGDIKIATRQVPTVFTKSIEEAVLGIKEIKPDLVIAVGQAGGRPDITVERVALNINDATIPDNENNQPIDILIVEGGPPAYFSTLPIKAIVANLKDAGIPANISNTAGTFVCNHMMYGILHHIAEHELVIRAGFVHVPYLPQQAINHRGAPSMCLATMVSALKIAITTVEQNTVDL